VKRLLALVVLAAVACGKRGDPRPPVPVIPQATSDLVVAQRATKMVLSWAYPAMTTAGRSLPKVRRVSVFRYVEELPVPAEGRDPETMQPGDIDPTVPRSLALFSKIPPIGPAQFAKLSSRLDSIESANLPAATSGARLLYEDDAPFRATDGRPVRVTYAVVTEGESARSEFSNLVSIVPLDVAVPPSGVTATARAEGVVLSWNEPKTAATGSNAPVITGYNVFRVTPSSTPADELPPPINNAPVKGTTYTDVPDYGEYQYRVTAVSAAGPPRIESEPSAIATATFKDLVAPPPPQNINILLETKAVRLVWDDVDVPDIYGYLIYRTDRGKRLKLIPHPSTEAQFQDISVEPGIEYLYEITSVDKSRNESAPTKSRKVLVPRSVQ
jgi:hypothetical protein